MHRFAPVALATILAATAPALVCAQTPTPFTVPTAPTHFTDPANLAGERPRPRDGRELPIDGGLSANGQPDNALGLAQMLRRLNTRASLMLIVAHPDDEDGGMLTYYSRGLGARVAVLTLTRGEGGQNAMTGDFEDALGLLRTQELLSADRYMGVDQFFGTEVDFGFTKTKSEAFAKWGHDRVLYDAVRAVRIYRPLVIAAVFSGAVTDGHGQHQVSGQIAQEVFKAAGDPTIFPELTREGILPWQPLKVYARVPFSRVTDKGLYDYATGQTVPAEFTNYVTGQTFTTAPTADVTINEGATDPLLTTCSANSVDLQGRLSSRPERSGVERPASPAATDCQPLSYVQFARIGLGLQRSQIGGGDRISRAGRVDVSYHLYGSRVCAPNLPNPTPKLCSVHATTAANDHESGWPILSRSERVGYRAARDKMPSASPMLVDFTNTTKAPTARSIPAQGNALGTSAKEDSSAEGAPYNPTPANQPNFFDGIDTSLAGIATLAPSAKGNIAVVIKTNLAGIEHSIAEAQLDFKPDHPELAAHRLSEALTLTDMTLKNIDGLGPSQLPAEQKEDLLHELRIKRAQLNGALVLAIGLSLDGTTNSSDIVTKATPSIHILATTSSGERVPYFSEELDSATGTLTRGPLSDGDPAITKSTSWTSDISATPQLTKTETRPYFFRDSIEQPVYKLSNPALRNAPATPPALTAWINVTFQGVDLKIGRVVHSGPQPVQIIPPVSLTLDRNAQVLPEGTHSLNVDVHTVSEDHPQGELRLHAPQDWTIRSQQRPLRAGTETFPASLPAHPLTTSASLKAEAIISGTTYTEGFRPVGYGTLPRTNYFTPATLRVVPVDLKLPRENKRRIAYLPGTGDAVPEALASIGLTPTILKVSDLTPANLSKYDTVILGVRTYNAHPDLHGAPTQALFDFARNGGNVVVQYQTNEFSAADAPYPLELHGERVIDETAPVKLLDPSSPLLTTPNKITPADFNNWIEERGHGFLDSWNPHYTALTETHDPGAPSEHIADQAPQRGGLITTQLGKGRWTYCAFALYRQLPEAVPGAFRLFVNLLNP